MYKVYKVYQEYKVYEMYKIERIKCCSPPPPNVLSKLSWDYQLEISCFPLESELVSILIAGRHSKTSHSACFALDITARPRSAATGRSKSLLGRVSNPRSDRNRYPNVVFRAVHSTSLPGRARQSWGARKHGSRMLRSHLAPENAARASF